MKITYEKNKEYSNTFLSIFTDSKGGYGLIRCKKDWI